ncbi:N-acetylmuramyl-L-alanine amidase, negative regulator of AmpC, AmpD [Musicola paradisiaca Ech703]|uniref:N-acetylmuramoyl-L-alanine amidase n=2 Tax=Musicola paradisiaca TaxID=69223 RepID=C6C7W7_MUSP7|nr:N-acetylmuramyl-L-alanine amidase, negative regulator of AmpC, AmpD [Musicola paradisiaca Ech703]
MNMMRRLITAALLLTMLSGCQMSDSRTDEGRYVLEQAVKARSHSSRVQFLVIHYTVGSFPQALQVLTEDEVSAHYLIPAVPPLYHSKPMAWQLVPESQSAWHAGVSHWRGYSHLNQVSIGIELENPGQRDTASGAEWTPYPASQIALVADLARDIIRRYAIAPPNVVAHSDIAPQRKTDPGPLFPWQALAEQGIGAWPDPERVAFYLQGRAPHAAVDRRTLLEKLGRYGYEVTEGMSARQQQRVIAAFQMHFRPQRADGQPDAETDAMVDALLEKYGASR